MTCCLGRVAACTSKWSGIICSAGISRQQPIWLGPKFIHYPNFVFAFFPHVGIIAIDIIHVNSFEVGTFLLTVLEVRVSFVFRNPIGFVLVLKIIFYFDMVFGGQMIIRLKGCRPSIYKTLAQCCERDLRSYYFLSSRRNSTFLLANRKLF